MHNDSLVRTLACCNLLQRGQLLGGQLDWCLQSKRRPSAAAEALSPLVQISIKGLAGGLPTDSGAGVLALGSERAQRLVVGSTQLAVCATCCREVNCSADSWIGVCRANAVLPLPPRLSHQILHHDKSCIFFARICQYASMSHIRTKKHHPHVGDAAGFGGDSWTRTNDLTDVNRVL